MRPGLLLIVAVAVLVVGFLIDSATFRVHQTEQVLVLQFGKPVRVVTEPGLEFKIPFVQQVERLDNRILGLDAPAEEIIASDQKRLVVDSFVRYKITGALQFFQAVGNERVARQRLNAILVSSLRRVLGEVPLSVVLTGERAELMINIRDQVNAEAIGLGVEVVDVRIKRADLPEANSQAIYARMNTEREREAREFRARGAEIGLRIRARADRERTVLLAEAERESQVIRGEGDGTKNKIFAEAYGRDPEFFNFYRSMLAYAEALGQDDTTMVLSPDSEFFRYFGETPRE